MEMEIDYDKIADMATDIAKIAVSEKYASMVDENNKLKRQIEELKEDIGNLEGLFEKAIDKSVDRVQDQVIESVTEFLTENHGYKYYINEMIKSHIKGASIKNTGKDPDCKFPYKAYWYDRPRQLGMFKTSIDRNLAKKMLSDRMIKLDKFSRSDFDLEHEWNVIKTEITDRFGISPKKLTRAYGSIVEDVST